LRDNGKLAYRIVNDHFEKIPGKSVFVPRETIVEYFTNESPDAEITSTALYRETFELLNMSTKINRKQFDLRNSYIEPGTRIADRVTVKNDIGLQYDILANPADLDRVIEAARTGKDFVPTPIRLSLFALIFRWGFAIIGLCMIIYFLYRKFMR